MSETEVAPAAAMNQEDIPLPGFLPDAAAETAETPGAPAEAGAGDAGGDFAGLLRRHEEARAAEWRARVEAWRDEVAADPELGGERFEASVARAQLALGRFDEGGRIGRLLEASGYGNHPDILRFFNRLADAVMEDVPAPGSAEGALAPLEERMYPGWHS